MPNYRDLRDEVQKYYKNIGYATCPALGKQKVHFKNVGFKHLIYKQKRFRPIADQVRRLKLVKYAKDIIQSTDSFSNYLTIKKGQVR